MEQRILSAENNYRQLDDYLTSHGFKTVMLVCDSSIRFLKLDEYFRQAEERLGIRIVRFSDFQPNPLYESVVKGVEIFNREGCQGIIAVGGGSGMDVAKCIKLYHNMDPNENYLKQEIEENDVPFLAVPTTAGTGSEATRFAVIYYEGVKQSVNHLSCIPDTVLFDPSTLRTLPLYQKKSTMMDALSHSIEAFWSINSTEESRQYSRIAIKLVLDNMCGYLKNEEAANRKMLEAAHIAGKAINLAQTTAGHAMSYKLASIGHIAHGHSTILVNEKLLPWMVNHTDRCIDPRGREYLEDIFLQLAHALGKSSPLKACEYLSEIVKKLEFSRPEASEEEIEVMVHSVNLIRLKNNPIALDEESIRKLYHEIVIKR